MIPAPNLDDRTHADIVEEALRLIPQYCPEWTNHNATDPGITLIELFAWMTEMVVYRLNKVTDKNFLAFLDLMGVDLQPPQPARTLLRFNLSEGSEATLVKSGAQVATAQSGVGEAQNAVSEARQSVEQARADLARATAERERTERALARQQDLFDRDVARGTRVRRQKHLRCRL